MSLDDLFNKLISRKLGDDFGGKLMNELSKSDTTGEDALISDIIDQYCVLLSCLKVKTPSSIKISVDDLSLLVIDGEKYDLDVCFSHSNRRVTECRAAIDALFADLYGMSADINEVVSYIEKQLCEK